MENGVTDPAKLATLLSYYDEAEDASRNAREKSERDRDYYDGKQLTAEEEAELTRRGQPPIAMNHIREQIDYLQGWEKEKRGDPKAYPRNPDDTAAADAFTDGLRYVADVADYHSARSMVWKNVTVEGYGGVELSVTDDGNGGYDVATEHVPWDRLVYDPHSAKPDFSDARYLGQVIWLDEEDALARVEASGGDAEAAKAVIASTLSSTDRGETYDDKPRNTIWADPKRSRVRICVMWVKKGADWHIVEFTRGGILSSMPSPYLDRKGKSLCMMVLESAYVDRDNNRYGVVRDLIDPQDESNKRRSKSLHLLTVQGVIADQGAVTDKDQARRELSRPDFFIETVPNARFEIVKGLDLAQGQALLGGQAVEYMARRGANAALRGKGTENQSGKAIEAQQAGGSIALGDLTDTLRRLDLRVYRLMAALMQQFWTAERWIRVTDDDLSPQYVGLNAPVWVDQMTGEEGDEREWKARQAEGADLSGLVPKMDPMTGQQATKNSLAEMDMDIIVGDAPDMINNSVESYQALTQAITAAVQGQFPPPLLQMIVKANPAMPTRLKKELLDVIEKMSAPNPEQQQAQAEQQQIMKDKAAADIEKVRADAFRSMSQGEAAARQATQPMMTQPDPYQGQPIAA